ncbi:MAG: hypothetical protein CMO66_04705 [Verrucomicrobiales bacterium]|nr:hypothetical protein [Verrucomicrobiales bacterium]
MSEQNPNPDSGWQTYEVAAIALCAGLALWGLMSGASSARARAMHAERASDRQKAREAADAKAETALTTFAALDSKKTRFRVPIDLAMEQAAIKMGEDAGAFRESLNQGAPDPLVEQGKTLSQTKICFTCHQIDSNTPAPAGLALKAPVFMGDFWGKEREVQLDADPATPIFEPSGEFETVVMDEAYVMESIEKPMLKITKGAIPGMAPAPTTEEERKALAAYIKSLSE